uniref:Uncharacterized protein n=1 Tax=uncultured marine virus TaxID=186617 RepID=A0A0F7L5G2_9VIRU|nr:hypothetical protein [uncultured marine virus]
MQWARHIYFRVSYLHFIIFTSKALSKHIYFRVIISSSKSFELSTPSTCNIFISKYTCEYIKGQNIISITIKQ